MWNAYRNWPLMIQKRCSTSMSLQVDQPVLWQNSYNATTGMLFRWNKQVSIKKHMWHMRSEMTGKQISTEALVHFGQVFLKFHTNRVNRPITERKQNLVLRIGHINVSIKFIPCASEVIDFFTLTCREATDAPKLAFGSKVSIKKLSRDIMSTYWTNFLSK